MTIPAICEKSTAKPFNPLLGETYEFENDQFRFLGEQVSFDPQIYANYVEGKNPSARYFLWNNVAAKTRFKGKSLEFKQVYNTYIKLMRHGETYEICSPHMVAKNLVFGTPYVDLEGTSTIKLLEFPELTAEIRFKGRGWFTAKDDDFGMEGEVYYSPEGCSKEDSIMIYRIHGHWNKQIKLSKFLYSPEENAAYVDDSTEEIIFTKKPYQDNVHLQYGLSDFSMQLNYFPKWLQEGPLAVAPTDTRRRPD